MNTSQASISPLQANDEVKGNAHIITIEVDGVPRTIKQGKYVVSALKAKFSIPSEYELDRVVGGKFHPLTDDETIQLHPNEQFVSHVRHGASS